MISGRKQKNKQFVLSGLAVPRLRLQKLCELLNEKKKTKRGKELCALIARWQKAESLDAMLRDDPGLGLDLHRVADPRFEASKTGKGGSYQVSPTPPNERVPHTFAVWMFAHLVTNPLCDKLAGPCARCGNYYVMKRDSQRVYCSRHCGNAATATVRTAKNRREAHEEKLKQAHNAVRRWKPSTGENWKEFVAKQTGLTVRWITRAVNKGELRLPAAARAQVKPGRTRRRV